MAGGDPWRNRKIVRICSALDMLFPLVIMGLYMYRLVFEKKLDEERSGFFTQKEKQGVTIFLWFSAFTVNIIQFFLTYYLFTAVKLGARDADLSIRSSRLWLIFSNFLFVVLLSEFIFFLFFDKKDTHAVRRIISTLLCAAELFYKPLGMYFVKDFIDDLKSIYSPPPAKAQFLTFINSVKKPQNSTSDV